MDAVVKSYMLRQKVQWFSYQNVSGSGKMNYAEPEIINCKIVGKIVYIQNLKGILITSSQQCYVDEIDVVRIKAGDLLQLPNCDKKIPIAKVEPFYKGANLDFGVVYLE